MEVKFPNFGGKNPRNWVRRFNLLFQANFVPDCYKISIVADFLHEESRRWLFFAMERDDWFSWNQFSEMLIGLYGFGENELHDYGVSHEYEFSEVWEVSGDIEERRRPVLDVPRAAINQQSSDAVAVESIDQVDEIDELRMQMEAEALNKSENSTALEDCPAPVSGEDSPSIILAELSTGTDNLPFLDKHEVLAGPFMNFETSVKSLSVDNLKYIHSVRNLDETVMLDVKFGVFWNEIVKPCEFGDHGALDSDGNLKNAMEIEEVNDENVETILCYDPGIHGNDSESLKVDIGSVDSYCAGVIALGDFDNLNVVVYDGVSVGIPEYARSFDAGIAKNLMTLGDKNIGESYSLVVTNNSETCEPLMSFDPGIYEAVSFGDDTCDVDNDSVIGIDDHKVIKLHSEVGVQSLVKDAKSLCNVERFLVQVDCEGGKLKKLEIGDTAKSVECSEFSYNDVTVLDVNKLGRYRTVLAVKDYFWMFRCDSVNSRDRESTNFSVAGLKEFCKNIGYVVGNSVTELGKESGQFTLFNPGIFRNYLRGLGNGNALILEEISVKVVKYVGKVCLVLQLQLSSHCFSLWTSWFFRRRKAEYKMVKNLVSGKQRGDDRVEAVCGLHCVHNLENAFLGGSRLMEYKYLRSGAETDFDHVAIFMAILNGITASREGPNLTPEQKDHTWLCLIAWIWKQDMKTVCHGVDTSIIDVNEDDDAGTELMRAANIFGALCSIQIARALEFFDETTRLETIEPLISYKDVTLKDFTNTSEHGGWSFMVISPFLEYFGYCSAPHTGQKMQLGKGSKCNLVSAESTNHKRPEKCSRTMMEKMQISDAKVQQRKAYSCLNFWIFNASNAIPVPWPGKAEIAVQKMQENSQNMQQTSSSKIHKVLSRKCNSKMKEFKNYSYSSLRCFGIPNVPGMKSDLICDQDSDWLTREMKRAASTNARYETINMRSGDRDIKAPKDIKVLRFYLIHLLNYWDKMVTNLKGGTLLWNNSSSSFLELRDEFQLKGKGISHFLELLQLMETIASVIYKGHKCRKGGYDFCELFFVCWWDTVVEEILWNQLVNPSSLQLKELCLQPLEDKKENAAVILLPGMCRSFMAYSVVSHILLEVLTSTLTSTSHTQAMVSSRKVNLNTTLMQEHKHMINLSSRSEMSVILSLRTSSILAVGIVMILEIAQGHFCQFTPNDYAEELGRNEKETVSWRFSAVRFEDHLQG